MKGYWKWTSVTTLISYLIIAAIRWDIIWIKDFPNFTGLNQFVLILIFIVKEIATYMVYESYQNIKNIP